MKKQMLILMLLVCTGASCSAAWWSGKSKKKPEITTGQLWASKVGGDMRLVFDVSGEYVLYGYKDKSDVNYPSVKTKKRFRDRFELIKDVESTLTITEDDDLIVWTITEAEPIEIESKACGLIHCTKECYRCDVNKNFIPYSDSGCCYGVNSHSKSCENSIESLTEKVNSQKDRIKKLESKDRDEGAGFSGAIALTTGQPSITTDVFVTTPSPKKPYLHKNPTNDHWICSKHGDLEPNDYTLYFNVTITFYGDTIYCYKCFSETFDKLCGEYMVGVQND